MSCATKFIDFFVHDILDYTILNKDSENFTKNLTVFNIEEAIHEIAGTAPQTPHANPMLIFDDPGADLDSDTSLAEMVAAAASWRGCPPRL